MRSLSFTLVLALAATLFGGLAGWCLLKGDLTVLLGVPPTAPGVRLYPTLKPGDVRKIQVSTRNADAEFVKTGNGWVATRPWQDRMDPQAAMAIIGFTLGMRVEDSAAVDDVPPGETGLAADQAVAIRLEGADGKPLAKFRLGKRAPWLAQGKDSAERVACVYVQPTDKNRKSHVFVCTGDVLPLFRNNLAFLRDHHPFYFHPALLREIRIRSAEGEMTLARTTPQTPWRITKPLELAVNPDAVSTLITGLAKLTAVAVTDQAAAPAAAATPPAAEMQLSLACFNTAAPAVLEIRPPASPTARDAPATVSDRPGSLFSLPLKPERDLVSLADIPTTVNDLRDPALIHLDRDRLHAVVIQPATGQDLQLLRDQDRHWTTRVDGIKCMANELRFYELLTTLNDQRALEFVSDAATDFSPWGLDRPVLRLMLSDRTGVTITLRFGLDKRGRLFANRLGSPSVMRLDPSLLGHIAVNPYEWRQSRLWALNRVDLQSIERTMPGQPTLVMKYDFFYEKWTVTAGDRDVSDTVNPLRANYMLGGLEEIDVLRWLAPNDPAALAALAAPELTLKVAADEVDEHGRKTGAPRVRTISLAPQPGAKPPQAYYGRCDGERYLFLLDPATYERLATDPFANR